jgi:hypothetical protein
MIELLGDVAHDAGVDCIEYLGPVWGAQRTSFTAVRHGFGAAVMDLLSKLNDL